jgi:excisionase family DNA binding protein
MKNLNSCFMTEITFEKLPQAVTQLYNKLENIERLLLEQSNESQSEPDQLLTIQQAGEFLYLAVPTLYRLVQRAEVPVCKRGKRLYFSKQELTEWVKAGRKKTLLETEKEAQQYINKKGLNNGK